MTANRTFLAGCACVLGLILAACGSGGTDQSASGSAATVQINGAGATFPFPIYSKWFDEYHKLHPNVQINYQSVGSGAGIRQLVNQTVFFGATDGPMTDEQQQVIILRFIEGLRIETVAELMGKQANAIKALQFRALRSLAGRLERSGFDIDSIIAGLS